MKAIYPINEEQCKAYYGRPVFALLADGAELVGTLSRWDGGKLVLNGETGAFGRTEAAASAKAKKRAAAGKKAAGSRKPVKAHSAAVTEAQALPFPAGSGLGGPITLQPADIAYLFALA